MNTVQDYPNVPGKGHEHGSGLSKCPRERPCAQFRIIQMFEGKALGTVQDYSDVPRKGPGH